MELKDIYKEIETIIKKVTTEGIMKEECLRAIKLRDQICYYEQFLSEAEKADYSLFFDKIEALVEKITTSSVLYKYSPNQLTTIQQKASILPLVLRDRPDDKMRMQGSNGYMFVCPVHHEKTPSFRLKDSINGFYCFGCGSSGNVFRYIQSLHNKDISFKDTVELLSKIYMYQETKKDDKYYDLIYKYWYSIISSEYKEFLLMGEERLKKYNMDFMPGSYTHVSDYYADRFQMIERIKNRCLDTSLNLERPREKRLILKPDDLLTKIHKKRLVPEQEHLLAPPEKVLVLKQDNLYINRNGFKYINEDDDDDDELPF